MNTTAGGSGRRAGGTLAAVEVAGRGLAVGAVGAAVGGSAASFSLSGSLSLSGPRLFGGDPVRALHRYALVGGALPRARPAGAAWRSGRDGGSWKRRCASCSGIWPRLTGSTGRV